MSIIRKLIRKKKDTTTTQKEVKKDIRSGDLPSEGIALEFVAIPPDFEIENHLSMREQAGIIEYSTVRIKQVKIIASAVRYSPVFATLNNPNIEVKSCIYFLNILHELDLIVKTIPNPFRSSFRGHYEMQLPGNKQHVFMDEHMFDVFNFVIINVVNLLTEDIIGDAVKISNKIQNESLQLQKEVEALGTM